MNIPEEDQDGEGATFALVIRTDSAAFEFDNGEREIARILRRLADKLEVGSFDGINYGDRCQPVLDENGNTVGRVSYDAERINHRPVVESTVNR